MTMLIALAALTMAQASPPAPTPLQVQVPVVPGLTADPTCGGREGLNTIATCFVTTQAAAETVVDALNADFSNQGWLAADGRENRVVYVKRKPGGGCDAFQLLAFAGANNVSAPAAPAYLALAAIPSDICTAAITAPATPPVQ